MVGIDARTPYQTSLLFETQLDLHSSLVCTLLYFEDTQEVIELQAMVVGAV